MCSKPSSIKKSSDVEPILTRKKSSLLKMHLRNTSERTKNALPVVQLSKGPTSKQKRPKTSPTKSPKKLNIPNPKPKSAKIDAVPECPEFYPDKLKRKVKVKKVLLKPKHEMKFVGNKRKLQLPQRSETLSDIQAIPKGETQLFPTSSCKEGFRSECSDWKMQDLVQMTDDQNLDDEDFLEILTCESPVWWEDPPNDYYTEEAISTRSSECCVSQIPHTVTSDSVVKKPPDTKNDDKFIRKRSKLEKLLLDIKNKINAQTIHPCIEGGKLDSHPDDVVKESPSKVKISSKISDEREIYLNKDEMKVNSSDIPVSTEEDVLLNFPTEEINEALCNTYIPIENDTDRVIVIDDSEDSKKSELDQNVQTTDTFLKTDENVQSLNCESLLKHASLEPLKQYVGGGENELSSSPITIKSEESVDHISLASDSDNDNADIPSKSNINSVENDCWKISSEKIVHTDCNYTAGHIQNEEAISDLASQSSTQDVSKKVNVDKEQLMVVYKIITDEDYGEKYAELIRTENAKSHETEIISIDTDSGSSFTYCKDINVNCERMSPCLLGSGQNDVTLENQSVFENEESNPDTKDINNYQIRDSSSTENNTVKIISNVNSAKYCLKCSSIFESDYCTYCVNNSSVTIINDTDGI